MAQFQAGTDGAKPATATQQAEQASELQQQAAGKALAAAAAQPQRPLEKPEPEKFSVPVPEGLAYEMVDLIKLTAQHVARNGSGFLTGQLWATGWLCCTQAGPNRGQSAQACTDILAIKLPTKGPPLRSQCLLESCTGNASGDTHSSGTWPRSPNTGHPFAAGLAKAEHSNPQFYFLKPNSSLFGFFTALCDAYSRVLMPEKEAKGLLERLRIDAEDR